MLRLGYRVHTDQGEPNSRTFPGFQGPFLFIFQDFFGVLLLIYRLTISVSRNLKIKSAFPDNNYHPKIIKTIVEISKISFLAVPIIKTGLPRTYFHTSRATDRSTHHTVDRK